MSVPRLQALVLLSLGVLAVEPARAEVNFWDRVRDPRHIRAERVLLAAERSRVGATEVLSGPAFDELYSRRTALLIELGGGTALGDPRLCFLLGTALIDSGEDSLEQGRDILRQALEDYPNSPLAARAWERIASASVRLGQAADAEAAYTRALDLEWAEEARATLLLNRGETRMNLKKLPLAIADYGEALRQASDPTTLALARFGLAVALDRDNNSPLAHLEILKAVAIRFGDPHEPIWAIDLPSVWFYPSHESHYYRALALTALGLRATEQSERVQQLGQAVQYWKKYLDHATAADPFAPAARRNLNELLRKLGSNPAAQH